jgi:hypothetical protein
MSYKRGGESKIVATRSLAGDGVMVTFLQAYNAAVARYSDKPWVNASPAELAQAIYLEMRRMDAEQVAAELRMSAKRRSSASS